MTYSVFQCDYLDWNNYETQTNLVNVGILEFVLNLAPCNSSASVFKISCASIASSCAPVRPPAPVSACGPSAAPFEDPDEDPAGCPIDRHEQVAAGRFFSHLRKILHIDMQISTPTPWAALL